MKTFLKGTRSVSVPENQLRRLCIVCLFLFIPVSAWTETVGVFFDQKIGQFTFAAYEVKAALEKIGTTAEMLDIVALEAAYGRRNQGTFDGTSAQLAIADVWDMAFWQVLIDAPSQHPQATSPVRIH